MRKIAIAAILPVFLAACGSGIFYSDGSRVGVVQKFSKSGLFFPTWDGELVMDGIKPTATSNGGAGLSNVWTFGAGTNETIARQIEDAMNAGYRVRLTYKQHVFTGPSWGTSYHVVKVERVQ